MMKLTPEPLVNAKMYSLQQGIMEHFYIWTPQWKKFRIFVNVIKCDAFENYDIPCLNSDLTSYWSQTCLKMSQKSHKRFTKVSQKCQKTVRKTGWKTVRTTVQKLSKKCQKNCQKTVRKTVRKSVKKVSKKCHKMYERPLF